MTIDSKEITRRSYTFIFLMTYHQLNSVDVLRSDSAVMSAVNSFFRVPGCRLLQVHNAKAVRSVRLRDVSLYKCQMSRGASLRGILLRLSSKAY
jgi:hypothetical protein